MPNVSVIMPTFNQAEFIGESVHSVLDQNLADFELIIVNDGSTDATQDYLSSLYDPRVRTIHQPNQGASAAMNRGFSEAKGEYLTWIASDNLYKPNFLERAVARITASDRPGLVYACFENIDGQGRLLDYVFLEPYFQGLLLENPGAVGVAFLYTREVYERVGEYRDLVCNDLDYWLRAAREFSFAFIPEVLASNRKHGAMQTVTKRDVLLSQVEDLLGEERGMGQERKRGVSPILRELDRWALRLTRALSVQGCPPGEELLLVGGRGALPEKVAGILAAEGYSVGKGGFDYPGADSSWKLALDPESEILLAGRKKVIPLLAPLINV